VKQDIVSVSPQVNGQVVQVFVRNGMRVKQGDLLFRIDPQPYRVALENAQAQLAAAQLQTKVLKTTAAGTGGDIAGAQANLRIKQNALGRQQALLKEGFTTRANYEDALNEVKTAQTQLADAQARAANANAAVAPGQQPQVAQAQAAVDKAKLDLERTDVRAPMDGVVENADDLLVGKMAVTGIGMMSLVHSQAAWVEANFKEKDVGRMVPGQRAEITVDAYPGVKFPAHVQSIGAGTGSEFSLLPAQNANGNWVKVTQRVPVRIAFNSTPSKPMIAGLSVNATVFFDNK
jgi:membrane fusion protein (multidrug efflux system)